MAIKVEECSNNAGLQNRKIFYCEDLTQADDLGRVVIPKEIRRTLRIREGDPPQTTLGVMERLYEEMVKLAERNGWKDT